jgi:predicted alpha/beta-fold hydrolase
LGGFLSRDDYYQRCSAKDHLGKIKIPTVILTAQDDPFVDFVDYQSASFSDQVLLHSEKVGGHMGYLSLGVKEHRWLDYALREYLQGLKDL